MVKKYKRKPIIIEAMQFDGSPQSAIEISKWMGLGKDDDLDELIDDDSCMSIETLEGVMKEHEGSYIIKVVKGEFYPCKSDIFEATYEEVSEKED